jgi:VanZ family protein
MNEKFKLIKFLEGKNYYGYDKYLHVFISTLLVIIFLQWLDLFLAAILVGLFGIIKELFDKFFRQEKFGFKDLAADLTGVFLGIIIVILVLN